MNDEFSKAVQIDKPEWLIAQYRPNAHGLAERNIRRQGYEVFLPLLRKTSAQGNRFVHKASPLFPGYIFVNLGSNKASNWVSIKNTIGVSQVLCFGQKPALLPNAIIDALKERCNPHGIIRPLIDLLPGQQVKICAGPFADFIGTIEQMESESRILLLVQFLGRETKTTVPYGALEPI